MEVLCLFLVMSSVNHFYLTSNKRCLPRPTHATTPDPAVMQAWAEDQGIAGSFVNMMGDPAAELTKALDVEMTDSGPPSVGIIGRCKRFALHVVDGEVKYVAISEGPGDPAGDDDPSASLAPAMLENI